MWLDDDGEATRIVHVPADPISALRGSGRGHSLLAALLRRRREDRERELAALGGQQLVEALPYKA
jgi:hypothetical protein